MTADDIKTIFERARSEQDENLDIHARLLLQTLYADPSPHWSVREAAWRVLYKGEDPEEIAKKFPYTSIQAKGVRTLTELALTWMAERINKTDCKIDTFIMGQLSHTWKAETKKQRAERHEREKAAEKRIAKLAAIERNLRAKQGR